MSLFKFNYKHHGTAFFFNALFTAVTFAIILVFNDQLDKYLEKQDYFHDDTHPYIKGGVHAISILIVTFVKVRSLQVINFKSSIIFESFRYDIQKSKSSIGPL